MTEKSSSWWQTLPGILTACTGVITAIAGLIVALHQAGLISQVAQPEKKPVVTENVVTENSVAENASVKSIVNANQDAHFPRQLSSGQQVQLADVIYQLLTLQLAQYNMEKRSLTITLRLTNQSRYSANLWDASFRLLVDGIPLAPSNQLNEVVAGNSAMEGKLVFVFDNAVPSAVLRVINGEQSTDIPVDFSGSPDGH